MDKHLNRKLYRIGDFARAMGVTPDFLKHYEAQGLIEVEQRESGYRFYGFDQSARILEYMRLKNYGIAVKDMKDVISGETSAWQLLDDKMADMEKQITWQSAVLEEHRELKARVAALNGRAFDWEIRSIEPHCYLPHSDRQDFLSDERIYAILKDWMAGMPLVKSAMKVTRTNAQESADSEEVWQPHWGLMVSRTKAERLGLPMSGAVEMVPNCKAFVLHFSSDAGAFTMDDITSGRHPVFELMAKLNLEPADNLYIIVEMKFPDPEDPANSRSCGRVIVPLKA